MFDSVSSIFKGTARQEGPRILSGWKEIAAYLGRGVRTVQRWEKLGLPVHRPNAHLRSAVLATMEDIDHWVAKCGDGRVASSRNTQLELLTAELENLRNENVELRREMEILKQYMQQIQPPVKAVPPASAQAA